MNIPNPNYPPLPDLHCERVNSRVHVVGLMLGILLLPFLIFYSSSSNNFYKTTAALVYGISFITTFAFSSMFHSCYEYPRRYVLKQLDRISIYFLIAGSYTPLVFFYMPNDTGITLLIILWSLAIGGIFFELFLVKKYILISIPFYLLMGCMFVFTAKQFFSAMPMIIIVLILSGVFLYLAGIIFYVREKYKYSHAIWHSFVLAAALCHYAAIIITTIR